MLGLVHLSLSSNSLHSKLNYMKIRFKYLTVTLFTLLSFTINIIAQYAPSAYKDGSTAINADSSIFIDWASDCILERGPIDISNLSYGLASHGDESSGIGKADNNVVSLGDNGIAILSFSTPLANGDGWDFAVFENSFSDSFLELAFVEVSSNGIDFYRFPSTSLTQDSTQVGGFGEIDANKIDNLAGKYRMGFGVPFDLSDLEYEVNLNINSITKIKIVDVVGSINPSYLNHDSHGNIINDPWPTPFESSGFDLDAIGVINNIMNTTNLDEFIEVDNIISYPNPATNILHLNIEANYDYINFINIQGQLSKTIPSGSGLTIDISDLARGYYIIEVKYFNKISKGRVIKTIW